MNFKTFMTHFKIFFVGNKDFINKGYAMIPCRKCDEIFKSYPHYKKLGVYSIDTKCLECRNKGKDEEEDLRLQ